ncbi:hypothetical protein DID76_02555 [Candidatus Marinamargulisbacteria bacterium SCGC AG-414-C22]|nr:hypothetical protein DID76_02555 [Candidatus Marinamargulisbacteria bacterium SCGC AG-414-C22]
MNLPLLKDVLIQSGMFSDAYLHEFRLLSSCQLWESLQERSLVTEFSLQQLLVSYSDVSCQELDSIMMDPLLLENSINKEYQSRQVLPLYCEENTLYIGLSNPYQSLDFLQDIYANIKLILLPQDDIVTYFNQYTQQLRATYADIISQAYQKGASDIHFFFRKDRLDIYFRIQGKMCFQFHLSLEEGRILLDKIKLQSHLDVSLRYMPQNGSLNLVVDGSDFDVRVSTLPTVYGEDMVIRLYQQSFQFRTFTDLNVSESIQSQFKKMLSCTSGLILVTGPTGSGKTTTLYTMLMDLKRQQRGVIVTLEDPVETIIAGVRQTSINVDRGFTFSYGLKSVLRQDPDIIMVGEIRDAETARVVIEAAYTGHLVLATLHSADVKSTLLRLHSFGLDPFLINHSIKGIVSQRLLTKSRHDGTVYRHLDQESLFVSNDVSEDHMLDPLSCYYAGDLILFDQ